MNTQRLSLSSSVFADRIKKFDMYQHNSRTSQRGTLNPKTNHHLIGSDIKKTGFKINNKLQSSGAKKIKTKSSTFKNEQKKKMFQSSNSWVATGSTQRLALNAVAKSQISFGFEAFSNQFLPPKSRKTRKNIWQAVFYTFGLTVFIFALGVSVHTLLTNNNAREQIEVLGEQTQMQDEQGVVEGTGSDPAEAEVSAMAIANYTVNPELPRYLRIPDIGVFARIKHTGIDSDGAVDSPANIHDVSWFKKGAKPGSSTGSSLLLGHVSGWSTPGVFKNIHKLKVGSRFEVEKGSGEKIKYEVTKSEKILLADIDMAKILGTEFAGVHDLKLMTCSGKYNKETKSYEERFVVYAKVLR
jgi:LPXTG-site transpeptidase (sortase) family protein